jgi:hypothetical protein
LKLNYVKDLLQRLSNPIRKTPDETADPGKKFGQKGLGQLAFLNQANYEPLR